MGLRIINGPTRIISNPEPGCFEIVDIYWDPNLQKVVIVKKTTPP